MRKGNTIYVGIKPVMKYVSAIITCFSNNPEEVVLRARGRAISVAVEAVEVTRNRFMTDLLKPSVSIGTEEVNLEEGGTRNVSTIKIILRRKPRRVVVEAGSALPLRGSKVPMQRR